MNALKTIGTVALLVIAAPLIALACVVAKHVRPEPKSRSSMFGTGHW